MSERPIVIVGSGLAGYTLARELRKRDRHTPVTLVTRDDGSVYSKPMLSNALAQGRTPDALVKQSAATAAHELSVEVYPYTEAVAIDRALKMLHTRSGEQRSHIEYRQLVLALGAAPRPFDVPGAAPGQILAVNGLDDYRRWHARLRPKDQVLLIGAGLIGVEFANDLASAGHAVTVVDPAPHPLARLVPPRVGQVLREALEDVGVTLLCGHTLERIVANGPRSSALLDNGRLVCFDAALSATGLIANTALARQANLVVDNGIVADEYLATNDPAIFALGDCAQTRAGVLPYVLPLMAEARALAATLAGTPTKLVLPALPVTVKTPALPVVVCPPPAHGEGHWVVAGSGRDLHATFVSPDAGEIGYALTGTATKMRQQLSTSMPKLLAA